MLLHDNINLFGTKLSIQFSAYRQKKMEKKGFKHFLLRFSQNEYVSIKYLFQKIFFKNIFKKGIQMKLPDLKTINFWLDCGYNNNPGPWVHHSKLVANAAKIFAKKLKMDYTKAYIMGLVHDIGRFYGITQQRHCFDGYIFLEQKGFKDLGRVCITHCFPSKDITASYVKWDGADEDMQFIINFLDETEYDDYDRLIQLSDCISDGNGYILMEKRIIDVLVRYSTLNKSSIKYSAIEKIRKFLEIRDYFEQKLGGSIYSFLPNIIENTFSF